MRARMSLDDYRKSIGVLFQSGALFNSLSVADNVAGLPLRETGTPDLSEHTIGIMVKIEAGTGRPAASMPTRCPQCFPAG